MVMIFYNPKEKMIYIASSAAPIKSFSINNQNILDYIPNDDVLYVQNAHYMTRNQFLDWFAASTPDKNNTDKISRFTNFLAGSKAGNIKQNKNMNKNKLFIHTTANGTILLQDINTPKHPEGLLLKGKYHFVPLEEVGVNVLESSMHYKIAKKKKKVEIVNSQYIQECSHKIKQTQSPADIQLDKILVPVGMHAEDVAAAGGISGAVISGNDDAPTILVE